jgi:membrane protein YqaA with SNARE-associated domain
MSVLSGLLDWTQKILLPLGPWGLFILAFLESIFFPIPPDLLLIILALADPSNALWFALAATLGSVFGGIFGYSIGFYVGKPILYKLFKEEKINKVHKLFEKYESSAIFIAGFTPIPYKVFTLTAGSLYIDFKKFIIASFLSRGLRFFLIAGFIALYGEEVVSLIEQYFGLFTIGLVILVGIVYLVYRILKKKI